jgi:hypothetical protein
MSALERQVATLLAEAAGEPPKDLDPDALLTRAPAQRRRHLAPALAAAAVVAIAIPVGFALTGGPSSPAAPGSPTNAQSLPPGPTSTPPRDAAPEEEATSRVEATLAAVPLPPGAVSSPTELDPVKNSYVTSASPNEVRRTGWWTASGDVAAAIAYLKENPPDGMRLDGSGSSDNGEQDVEFATSPQDSAGYPVEVDYYVAPYQSGIAIRVDVWTTWAPIRPDWSFVPSDATSVDVSVVRIALNEGMGGAPTVRRTLTGDALTSLADEVNALASRAPEGVHSCPAITVQSTDGAVFHTPEGEIRVEHRNSSCAFNAVITSPQHGGEVYVPGNDLTDALLAALGLPPNYGFPR